MLTYYNIGTLQNHKNYNYSYNIHPWVYKIQMKSMKLSAIQDPSYKGIFLYIKEKVNLVLLVYCSHN